MFLIEFIFNVYFAATSWKFWIVFFVNLFICHGASILFRYFGLDWDAGINIYLGGSSVVLVLLAPFFSFWLEYLIVGKRK